MGSNGTPQVFAKETYRIGEVASLTRIEPHVLRYWETEFPRLRPVKSPHGQRLYRRADIELILAIKRLLYEEGFTIVGARKQLEGTNGGATPSAEGPPTSQAEESAARAQLRAVRAELGALLTLLSRR